MEIHTSKRQKGRSTRREEERRKSNKEGEGGREREREMEREVPPPSPPPCPRLDMASRLQSIPVKAMKAVFRKRLGECVAKTIHQELRNQRACAMHSLDRCPVSDVSLSVRCANHPTFTGWVSGPAPRTHAEEWMGCVSLIIGNAPACRKAVRRRVLTL